MYCESLSSELLVVVLTWWELTPLTKYLARAVCRAIRQRSYNNSESLCHQQVWRTFISLDGTSHRCDRVGACSASLCQTFRCLGSAAGPCHYGHLPDNGFHLTCGMRRRQNLLCWPGLCSDWLQCHHTLDHHSHRRHFNASTQGTLDWPLVHPYSHHHLDFWPLLQYGEPGHWLQMGHGNLRHLRPADKWPYLCLSLLLPAESSGGEPRNDTEERSYGKGVHLVPRKRIRCCRPLNSDCGLGSVSAQLQPGFLPV